jgi:sRNA-binding carbon storage regulator CsrA
MLVLSRKENQSVLVGRTIVTIEEAREGYVRVSFSGPDKVTRSELLTELFEAQSFVPVPDPEQPMPSDEPLFA